MSDQTNTARLVRDPAPGFYQFSRDYELLWELAQRSAVVCFIDYRFRWNDKSENPCRDVASTMCLREDGMMHHISIGVRGLSYIEADTFGRFAQACEDKNLEFLLPIRGEDQPDKYLTTDEPV